MRLGGVVAEPLIMPAPEVYGPMAARNSAGLTVLYVQLTRALYGCLKSRLRWYLQLSMVLQDEGFAENPYDSCAMNKDINGSQCTVCWHVDDLKISHKEPAVVDQILKTPTLIYGPLSVEKGRQHTYLTILGIGWLKVTLS